ncbi:hyaluronan mediated motility receptor isoform X2 [Solanum tuberosum]|uniref:hyaluronan mediated motility receptor isoform X2 n=1 Tax=Solanum tuberosum TaxID=4113 RepID=UPI00073A0B17|nr:PREDICTED: hyaluronan mediated motility receptor isoform X2 [Solanum tuberosum]
MEEEKKKRKNKKKKNKQTKGIENNAVGAEESASSNQNHPAEICGSEAHTDDTLGIDDDSNRHDIEGAKVSSLAENEKHCRMDSEATFEEKIKQLQKDKVSHMQKEAIFEEKLKQFSREKDASLLKEEASFEMKIMQLQDEISSLRRQEANQEEKIRQLHMEKDVYLQKEAEFEMKNSQLQSEKNSWLLKEAGLEKRNNELVDEVEKLNSKRVNLEKKVKEMEKETENKVQKEVSLEERISLLVDEVENSNSTMVSLEEKVKETEKERENWVQKEKSFREIISSLSGDNALLETQVKEFEELRTNTLQENQLLKAKIQVLQTQVYNLKKSAGPPCLPTGHEMNTPENGDLNSEVVATQALVDKLIDENAELVEKVKNLYVELERRGPPMEVSSYLDADVITTSSEAARIANESALGSHKIPGAVHEHVVDHTTEPKSQPSEAVLQSSERLQSLKDTIDKAVSDDEHVSKIDSRNAVNLSEIESDEIVQIPLDENEVQSADLEVTSVDQDQYEEVPLTNAPLIGAPFRLISFFARYVSGADLVNKNSATSNR